MYIPCLHHLSALSIIYRWPLPEQSRAKPCIKISTDGKDCCHVLESSPDSQRWLLLRGDQSAYRDLLEGS